MRDKSHEEQLERWAHFVKTHPKTWKKELKPFLDSQVIMANRVLTRLPRAKVLAIKGVE